MSIELLSKLERAVQVRNSVLAGALLPGLSEAKIRRMLHRKGVAGNVDPIVMLFGWKDGYNIEALLPPEQQQLFPQSEFLFMDLDFMLGHFEMLKEFAKYHPEFTEVAGRFFPLFWTGSKCWIAVDLDTSQGSRVVLIDRKSQTLVREVYVSFEEFLKDAIRANEVNDKLSFLK